ncbi:trypsin-like [Prorops nasuta]|uniref:trypsin-like n=1 Tax=Prorops nasuta TaxID=863751 RepID=UPI0034CF0DEA
MHPTIIIIIFTTSFTLESFIANGLGPQSAIDNYWKRISLESANGAVVVDSSQSGSRIIGGEDTTIENYPFAVSIQNNGTFFGHEVEHFCGGSIINESWIITSAHCAQSLRRQNFHVRAGTDVYYKEGQIYEIDFAVIHPNFDEISSDYDIGLLKLKDCIRFDERKQPIKLPGEDWSAIKDGTRIDVIGWGAKKLLGQPSDKLEHTTILKINSTECTAAMGGLSVTERMFCAFLYGQGPCIGDSGTPAVINQILIGVTSWSPSCAYRYPTAFVDVSVMLDWITETTKKFN